MLDAYSKLRDNDLHFQKLTYVISVPPMNLGVHTSNYLNIQVTIGYAHLR